MGWSWRAVYKALYKDKAGLLEPIPQLLTAICDVVTMQSC